MAQTVASMAGSTQAISRIDRRLHGGPAPACRMRRLAVRAQQADVDAAPSSRRAMLGLVAVGLGAGSFVQGVLAEAKPIKIGPAPPPSGGLPGTLNSDEPRDLDLAYKNRFYIQPLPADQAAQRAKDAAKEILGVKSLIAKKQWPYVQMDLRNKASYLRYDLETVIAAKTKEDKKSLKELTKDLFSKIENLDYAAKIKSQTVAEKCYAEAASALESVIAKLG